MDENNDFEYVFWWSWEEKMQYLIKNPPSNRDLESILESPAYYDYYSKKIHIHLYRPSIAYYLMGLIPLPGYHERLDNVLVNHYSHIFSHEKSHGVLDEKIGISVKTIKENVGHDLAIDYYRRTNVHEFIDKFLDSFGKLFSRKE